MNFESIKQLFSEEQAVSPVIGVILMVAITVILAAVIGTFVLGLGDQISQSQPSANIGFAYGGLATAADDDTVTITHKGGDKLDGDDLLVTIGGEDAYTAGATADAAKFGASGWGASTVGDKDSITAGDALTLTEVNDEVQNGFTVRVIWSADNGDTAIIAEGTVQ